MAVAHALADHAARCDVASMPRPIRVVIVDDQAPFRDAARAIVASTRGFELVGESADGAGALRLIRAVDPDLVLLDVRMPGLDGIDIATRLTADDPTRVIVLVSSADQCELSRLARSSGAAALLRKQWLTPRLLRGLWVAHRRR
jgi:DNA-binding NarL/FixJ family response regulator